MRNLSLVDMGVFLQCDSDFLMPRIGLCKVKLFFIMVAQAIVQLELAQCLYISQCSLGQQVTFFFSKSLNVRIGSLEGLAQSNLLIELFQHSKQNQPTLHIIHKHDVGYELTQNVLRSRLKQVILFYVSCLRQPNFH